MASSRKKGSKNASSKSPAAKKPVRKKKTPTKKAAKKKKSAANISPREMFTVGATAASLVPVTYVLTKSSDVEMKNFYIGDAYIDLEVDQDPNDPNKFATRGTKKYMCINDPEGLKVILHADGNSGGGWSLEIKRAGTDLADNPIEEEVDGNGHANHNEFHN